MSELETSTDLIIPELVAPTFNAQIFKKFISDFYDVIKQIEENIGLILDKRASNSDVQFDSTDSLKIQEIDTLLYLIDNYDFYDTLTLACLSGIYYNINKLEWDDLIDKLYQIPPRILTHKATLDTIDSVLLPNFDVEPTGQNLELFDSASLNENPDTTEEDDYIIDQVEISDFYYKIGSFDSAVNKFIEAVLLFAKLSKRLVFDDNSTINEIQSKHIDFGLKGKLDSIRVLLQENQDKEVLFVINLRLAELDEFLSCEDTFVNELSFYLIILHEIYGRKNEEDVLAKTSKNKCQFLIFKILKRIDRSSKLTNDGINFSTFHNQKQIILSAKDLEEKLKEDNSPYIDFLKKSNHIYSSEISESDLKDLIKDIESLHANCKVLKKQIDQGKYFGTSKEKRKYKASYEKIKNANLKHLESIDSKNISQKFAVTSFEYLIHNTTYKFDIESIIEEFTSLENLEHTYKSFIAKYDEFSKKCDFINNQRLIFPNIQHIRYFIQGAEKLLKNTKTIISKTRTVFDIYELERIEKAISEMAEYVGKESRVFFLQLAFLKNKNYYPVYNDIKSCKTSQSTTFKVYAPSRESNDPYIQYKSELFLDSSYVLPSNYSFLKFNMEENIRNIHNINSQILSLLEVFFTKNVEKSLDIKIKENQFNAIQTLSVYAIIITFILGSISALPKFEDGVKILPYFMLLLGFILGFFILCIRFLFINEQFIIPVLRIPSGRIRKYKLFWWMKEPYIYRKFEIGGGKIPRWLVYLFFMGIIIYVTFYYALPKYTNSINANTTKLFNTTIKTRNFGIYDSDKLKRDSETIKDSINSIKHL